MEGIAPTARHAWQALLKAVRTAHLYSPDHGEVDRWIGEFVRLVGQAVARGSLEYGFRHGQVELDGQLLLDTSAERTALVDRMAADGVRAFVFHGRFDPADGQRLLRLLAPYAYPDRAPLQPLSDRLHWEVFDGLHIELDVNEEEIGVGLDALTGRERAWREELSDLLHSPNLPRGALDPVWDGTRGRISWPPGEALAEAQLDQEVDDAVTHRTPAPRVGEALVAAVRAWRDDVRVDLLLKPLPRLVGQLLDRGRAGDVGPVLGPLLRWGGADRVPSWRGTLRDRVLALGGLLLEPDNLDKLAEQVRAGRVRPEDVVAWFGPLPAADLAGVLGFAASLSAGPCREALVEGCAHTVGDRSVLLRPVLLGDGVPAALAAFEVLEQLQMSRETVGLVLELLAGARPSVVVRAIRYLLPLRSRTVAGRLVPLIASEVAEIRSGALTYMARHCYRPAYDPLRDLTEGGVFGALPLVQRMEICRTLGIVGGADAESLALSHLPTGWARLDPERSLPWIVCLAAAGSAAATEYLEPASQSPVEAHRTIARDALLLWRRRVEAGTAPAAPFRTAPGAPVPVPLTDPGRATTGSVRAPPRWSHRAPLHSGQWSAPSEPEEEP